MNKSEWIVLRCGVGFACGACAGRGYYETAGENITALPVITWLDGGIARVRCNCGVAPNQAQRDAAIDAHRLALSQGLGDDAAMSAALCAVLAEGREPSKEANNG